MRAVGKEPPDLAAAVRLSGAPPAYNAMLRTTAVATQISGGQAENPLPMSATAVVNCRILPEDSPDDVVATLKRVLKNDRIHVPRIGEVIASPASPVNPAVLRVVEQITSELWSDVPVLSTLSAFASDGRHLRRAGIVEATEARLGFVQQQRFTHATCQTALIRGGGLGLAQVLGRNEHTGPLML